MDAVDKKRLRQDKKNIARRQHRQDAREALFVKEYLRHKYPDAYEEACAFYNYVNSIYPTKCDLRKTEEFKAMKLGFTFVAKNKDKVLTKPLQVYQPITNLSEQNFTIHCFQTPQMPGEIEQTATETPEEIEQTPTETPGEIEQPITETPQMPEEPPTEIPQATNQNKQTKTFQLTIPLLSPKLITETRKTITEESLITVASNQSIPEDIETIFNDEIPQETYDTIVRELRQDPELARLMDDIELDTMDDIELDTMDVDLPLEDDRLEQELYNLW